MPFPYGLRPSFIVWRRFIKNRIQSESGGGWPRTGSGVYYRRFVGRLECHDQWL